MTRIAERVGLPTASNYQIKIFEAVEKVVDDIISGKRPKSLIIEAKPGSGKTTTGVAATRLIPQSLNTIFVAFNKKIVNELSLRLPERVPARTFHSQWLRQWSRHIWKKYKTKAEINHYKVQNAVERHFKLNRYRNKEQTAIVKKMREQADDVIFLVDKAKTYGVVPKDYRLAQSAGDFQDDEYFWSYVMEYYDYHIDPKQLDETLEIAREILCEGLDKETEIDFDDMLYLPAVKQIYSEKFRIVMIDEAQDLNGLQRYLLSRMIDDGGMVMAIGDSRQCQPAGTMISIPGDYTGSRSVAIQTGTKPIEEMQIGDKIVSYATKKSHFTGISQQSGVHVEDTASRLYTGALYTICVGNKTTRATSNHKGLVRFNDTAKDKYCVYLMLKDRQFRIGTARLFYNAGFGPGQRARDEDADAVYVLEIVDSNQTALACERMFSHTWGIPDVRFNSDDGLPDDGGIAELIKARAPSLFDGYAKFFWKSYPENFDKGVELLNKFGRDVNYPIWSKGNSQNHVGKYTFVTQSCNLLDGVMSMRIFDGTIRGGEWLPIKVQKEDVVDLPVYSLKVTSLYDNEHRHLYVADGIVTHNSIYAFRGADAESMERIRYEFDCQPYPLSISYRCAQLIVAEAYEVYPEIEAAPNAPMGSVERPENWNLEDFKPGHLIICRNNAPTVSLAYRLIRNRISAKILGRDIGQGLIKLIKKCGEESNDLGDMMEKLTQWRDHQLVLIDRKNQNDERAKEQIRDKYNCIGELASGDEILDVKKLLVLIDQMFTTHADEKEGISSSRVTLSTIHKIKGGEADTVFLLDSHLINPAWIKTETERVQERNLLFVALTRAKTRLVFINSDAIKS